LTGRSKRVVSGACCATCDALSAAPVRIPCAVPLPIVAGPGPGRPVDDFGARPVVDGGRHRVLVFLVPRRGHCRTEAISCAAHAQGVTFFVVVLLFAAAELMRNSNVRAGILLSMLGWLLFVAFAILDTGVGRGWASLLRGLGWVLV